MGLNLYDIFLNEIVVKGLIVGVIGVAITTYLNENLNVLRNTFLIASAKRKMRTGKPKAIKSGVNMLVEIAIKMPYRKQEMLDIVTQDVFRKNFSRTRENPPVTPPEMVDVFVDSLKAILSVPRDDENHHEEH
jgi:hypothetical protein